MLCLQWVERPQSLLNWTDCHCDLKLPISCCCSISLLGKVKIIVAAIDSYFKLWNYFKLYYDIEFIVKKDKKISVSRHKTILAGWLFPK